ncbi:unnamed protein product [Brachionus calyciflorus]|uniref:Reverse transcriptase domain-containing protein n=1 Tax=Brachionus calyciflorus TaxID=104777 RepID=A0A813WD67_9BILA|nr:unnamed protein product [Brachionus calyciflorus]
MVPKLVGSWKPTMCKSSGLQKDLDIIINWSKIWSSDLNLPKCKSMSIGRKDQTEYEVFNRVDNSSYLLQRTDEEKDLVVYITSDLKCRKHCKIAASKANRALGQNRNSFCYLERNTFKLLYNALVRSHLEYAVSVWCSTLKGHIELTEKVQKRATKFVKSVRNLTYEERLEKLEMLRLEDRRVRIGLIQMFKIINGFEDINLTNGINYSISNTRNLRRGHDKSKRNSDKRLISL